MHPPATLSSAHVRVAPAPLLPSHPSGTPQPAPGYVGPLISHKVVSGAAGATHEVTVKQLGCKSASAQLGFSPLVALRLSPLHPRLALKVHDCSLIQMNRVWVVPFCSLPGEALTPLLQAPAVQEHQLSLHTKWPKSPVPSLGFPGRWPVVKLKINISPPSSTACPTLDNSCKGLTSPWRCNPSIKMTTFGPRHPGRCRMDKKQFGLDFFGFLLIPL